ncbi:MAG TPA: efflux transporter periplasmic adaptor subunit [Microscillaceae bacterium]|nr:efflux transporter periplasmic adaptor subunit [Microscillaceae bacterium]
MIRRISMAVAILIFVALSVWLGMYFYNKNKKNPIVYKVEKPFVADITKKTVATGSIVPRREVLIKPQVSGVIESIFVEPGQPVRAGQLIAQVKLVPNLNGLNNDQIGINSAQNNVETAKINFRNAEIELERQQKLYDQNVISQVEYNRFLLDFNVRKEALQAAENNLGLVRLGAAQRSGAVSNAIYSTVDGIILDVPVKVGSSVVERSNFNEGTTVASIADMQSLIFEGKIDESEVTKLKEGMELKLNIGALPNKTYKAILEYIAPKGVVEEGAIKFQIRAQIVLEPNDNLRAGYSANADIVLEEVKQVLAIKESALQFGKKDSVYVEIETQPQIFVKKIVKPGVSDGINVQVLEGITANDKIKMPIVEKEKKKTP